MKYIYYPGCSLKSTGKPYEESLLAVFKALNIQYEELKDWNCCGATAYMAIDDLKAVMLAARNIAIAEKQLEGEKEINIIAPCSACYMVLLKTKYFLENNPDELKLIQKSLNENSLNYSGKAKIRHPIDVLANDVGIEEIKKRVKKPLKGVRTACYYGCQTVRPYSEFDDQRNPQAMENILKAAGAETIEWTLKTRCCGASLTGTVPEVALPLSFILINEAKKRRAEIITTACSLCQFNLECYQPNMEKKFKVDTNIDVMYFTQLLGLALGIPRNDLGFKRSFMEPEKLFSYVEGGANIYV
jgi:heterodisulfide reductase subunit B